LPEDLQLKSESYLEVSFYSPAGALRNGPSQISCCPIQESMAREGETYVGKKW